MSIALARLTVLTWAWVALLLVLLASQIGLYVKARHIYAELSGIRDRLATINNGTGGP